MTVLRHHCERDRLLLFQKGSRWHTRRLAMCSVRRQLQASLTQVPGSRGLMTCGLSAAFAGR
jgi:hypothetical protein